ncbi:MAG: tetratricopeptide repeat protein [Spirochaetota bacterium]
MRRFNTTLLILIFIISLIPTLSLSAQEPPDALRLYNNGQYSEAVEVCLQELEEMPQNMDSYAVLCWSLVRLGRYDEALDYAEQGMQISRYDPRMVEIVGEIHYYQGRNLQALEWFEEYTVLAPTGSRIDTVYYLMGEIFIRLGEFHHADIAITTALYHTSSVAQWWARLGYAREQAQDYEYALEAYNEALKLRPGLNDAERGKNRVQEKMETG